MIQTIPESGEAYLDALARQHRRQHGKVYTPPALADFVLEQVLGEAGAPDTPVLDPACGAGVFLVAIVRQIARRMLVSEGNVEDAERRAFVAVVRATVWGIDSDPVAVELARRALFSAVEELSPGPLAADFFDRNVVVGDFLRDELSDLLPVAPKLVVGNPPYVSADRISAADKVRFRTQFSTAFGRLDLYTLFMERAARTVPDGGRWAFITPDKYLTSESARPLRTLLTSTGSLKSISVFDSHRVFKDAATVPCVTVWERTRSGGDGTRVDRVSMPGCEDRVPQVNATRMWDAAALRAPSWSFHRQTDQSLIARLEAGHRTLAELTVRISAGLATGYNPAFVLDRTIAESLEPELIHPTIRGRDVQPYTIKDRDEYILVPYTWSSDGTARLIDLDEYPKTARWFAHHEDRLRDRHCVRVWGKRWWDLHDPVGEPLHSLSKVVVPDLARSNRFAAEPGRYVPQHSLYYLRPTGGTDVQALAAILNSSVSEFLVRARAPLAKDGFSRYRKQFLLGMPVPEVDDETRLEIHRLLAEGRHDDLDVVTTELFGVDHDVVRRALESLPSRPVGGRGVTGA